MNGSENSPSTLVLETTYLMYQMDHCYIDFHKWLGSQLFSALRFSSHTKLFPHDHLSTTSFPVYHHVRLCSRMRKRCCQRRLCGSELATTKFRWFSVYYHLWLYPISDNMRSCSCAVRHCVRWPYLVTIQAQDMVFHSCLDRLAHGARWIYQSDFVVAEESLLGDVLRYTVLLYCRGTRNVLGKHWWSQIWTLHADPRTRPQYTHWYPSQLIASDVNLRQCHPS